MKNVILIIVAVLVWCGSAQAVDAGQPLDISIAEHFREMHKPENRHVIVFSSQSRASAVEYLRELNRTHGIREKALVLSLCNKGDCQDYEVENAEDLPMHSVEAPCRAYIAKACWFIKYADEVAQ